MKRAVIDIEKCEVLFRDSSLVATLLKETPGPTEAVCIDSHVDSKLDSDCEMVNQAPSTCFPRGTQSNYMWPQSSVDINVSSGSEAGKSWKSPPIYSHASPPLVDSQQTQPQAASQAMFDQQTTTNPSACPASLESCKRVRCNYRQGGHYSPGTGSVCHDYR